MLLHCIVLALSWPTWNSTKKWLHPETCEGSALRAVNEVTNACGMGHECQESCPLVIKKEKKKLELAQSCSMGMRMRIKIVDVIMRIQSAKNRLMCKKVGQLVSKVAIASWVGAEATLNGMAAGHPYAMGALMIFRGLAVAAFIGKGLLDVVLDETSDSTLRKERTTSSRYQSAGRGRSIFDENEDDDDLFGIGTNRNRNAGFGRFSNSKRTTLNDDDEDTIDLLGPRKGESIAASLLRREAPVARRTPDKIDYGVDLDKEAKKFGKLDQNDPNEQDLENIAGLLENADSLSPDQLKEARENSLFKNGFHGLDSDNLAKAYLK